MGRKKNFSRRKFVKGLAHGSLLAGAFPYIAVSNSSKEQMILKSDPHPDLNRKFTANDMVRLGVIGTGIIGFYN
jgi:hypothetical protein